MKQLLTLALLLLALPAFVADNFASALIHGSASEVKDAIARKLLKQGFTVSYDGTYKFVLSKPTSGGMRMASEFLLGNGTSERPDDVLTFDLAPGADGTRVVLRESISVLFRDGQTRETPLTNKKILKQENDFLSALESDIALHAALTSRHDFATAPVPETSILQVELGFEFDGDTVTIKTVNKGSAAEKGGLRAGDAVISINGKPIAAASAALKLLEDVPAGTKVEMSVLRDQHPADVAFTF